MDTERSVESVHAARASLALLRPYDVVGTKKIRVGRPFDGGYVMIDAFDGVEAAYSLGINEDVSWDFEIAQRGIDVFQYDHTIERLPEENSRFHWEALGIAATSSDNMRTLADIMNDRQHDKLSNMLLKCDIEGAEWEMLRDIPCHLLRKFSQIVIEIHDICRLGNSADLRVRQALSNLVSFHNVVHVHGNNYSNMVLVGGIPLPNVMELTLLRKDMGEFVPSKLTFPTPMDMPCNGAQADFYLGSFTFS